jgi:orotate phosphoribosyltransferase
MGLPRVALSPEVTAVLCPMSNTQDYERGCRAQLLPLIREKSVRIVPAGQEFTLSSGDKSRVYCDLKKTALLHEAAEPLAALILAKAAELGTPVAYAGVALGGCHLASIASSFSSGAHAVHVRKEAKDHGTKNLVEAPDMPPGSEVVLIEDITTTANSALRALAALQGVGYAVLGIITIVDRRNAWSKESPDMTVGGVPIRSIFRIEEFVPEEPKV